MESALIVLCCLILVRIVTLSAEQVAVHGLGQDASNALPTMAITFWGAAVILWGVAIHQGQVEWIGGTMWTGILYAVAFGLYTAGLSIGPVGSVSPWSNATIVLLWFVRPTGHLVSLCGIGLFVLGGWLLTQRHITRAIVMVVVADVFLVAARLIDASNTQFPTFAYAASLYTSIGLWMTIPIIWTGRWRDVTRLLRQRPGWSAAAMTMNASAYLTLYALLKRIPATLAEAVSTLAGVGATLVGVIVFREANGRRKVWASCLMTLGVCILLLDHYKVWLMHVIRW